ncbi:hypothetical protein DPMN_056185 [Dreissena polymorpha]|uniref:Uncharacterized protein n=1 Tax=Dreissena polymorpha TaxID=45954 RepID=A0A9D4CR86_DREPO|nr:hypothetical protein DPMN_056185 [Dreissena polymorpha]
MRNCNKCVTEGSKRPSLTMMPVWTTGMNRGSGKVLKCLIPPGVTGKDRQRPVRHWEQPGRQREQPGRHRSSTGAHADPGRATATHRLSPLVPR